MLEFLRMASAQFSKICESSSGGVESFPGESGADDAHAVFSACPKLHLVPDC